MIEWIKDWTEGIIIAVMLSIIIEMLVPEGKNKKYVKVVSGIYILYTIINPFLDDNFSLKNSMFNISIISNNSIQTNSDEIVANTYISSLEEYFRQKIIELGYETKDIIITCDSEYSEIVKIDIKMKSLNYDVDKIKEMILKEYMIDENNIIIS